MTLLHLFSQQQNPAVVCRSFFLWPRPSLLVEINAGLVPVQHEPLDMARSFGYGALCRMPQLGFARAQAALFLGNVKVLPGTDCFTQPRRVVEEVHGIADGVPSCSQISAWVLLVGLNRLAPIPAKPVSPYARLSPRSPGQ